MNLNEDRYSTFALVREMMDTPKVVSNFKPDQTAAVAEVVKSTGKLFLTGEGSSRIFPAKSAIRLALEWGLPVTMHTEGSRQAALYDLSDWVVFGASNSGSTKEVITLLQELKDAGHDKLYGLTARDGTKLAEVAEQTFVLTCGWENAVAATKSVVEQALFYNSIVCALQGHNMAGCMDDLATSIEAALTMEVPAEITDAVAGAGVIHFAGYNDGVAEELTLKTNEITRKKSDFLEGTYAVHGIEEVMNPDDVVIVVDPIAEEEQKFKEVLVDGVGMKVFAIANRPTTFPTLTIPSACKLSGAVQLAAGWNLLVEVGLKLGIDLDKPERARKVGNEFTG